jgi:hypothetical protein
VKQPSGILRFIMVEDILDTLWRTVPGTGMTTDLGDRELAIAKDTLRKLRSLAREKASHEIGRNMK